ncbi:MAG TPA: gamma-glutamylcyclotransferase family protein [Arenicellales bacterium]|nr:gamma-glutamylcyclotransferase family protein [Arenicellales bacterium]
MNKHLVFVYGTLRRGGSNHYILADSDFLGPYITEPRYTMFRLGQFPAVVARGDCPITGELYRVSDEVFDLIDELECYPSVFSRQIIHTPAGDAWMYLYNRLVGTDHRVRHGDWLKYLAESGGQ